MTIQTSMPRLTDVAKKAGVSIATASRALRGLPGVSEGVAAHIVQVAEEMGYVVDEHARTLASGFGSTIGLIVHTIEDPYFTEIAGGVVEAAEVDNLTAQICHSGRDPERELRQIRTLIAHRVQSLIIAGSGYSDPDVEAKARDQLNSYQHRGGRVVVIGRHRLRADAVLPDNVAAGRLIAGHIRALGHTRIAVLAGPSTLTTIEDRLAGIREVLDAEGLEVGYHEAEFTLEGGRAAAAEVLAGGSRPTAMLALSDAMAIGALSAVRAAGLRVPDDLSITGFDDISVAAQLAPGLSTARFPLRDMGVAAVELTSMPPSGRPRTRTIEPTLVVRDSTAPPPA